MNTLAGGNGPAKQLGSKQFLRVLLGTGAILMVPLVAMQFTREVNWTASDFVVAALLLAGTGMLFELATARLRTRKSRLTAVAVIGLGFLFVWAELAVGIVGSPFAGS
jgi:hypothetical protein